MAGYRHRLHSRIYLSIICLFIFSCEQELVFDNPLDQSNNPDFIEPETTVLTAINGLTIDSSAMAIEVSGNENVSYFSYKLDDKAWKDTNKDQNPAVIVLDYLDEGSHLLSVKARYAGGQEDLTPEQISFTVDAMQGPGLRIFPLLSEITLQDTNNTALDTIGVSIYAEDIDSVVFGEITINFDNTNLEYTAYENGSMLNVSEDNLILFVDSDSTISQTEIKVTFATDFTSQMGITGSGSLIKLFFTAIDTVEAEIDIEIGDISSLRNFENDKLIWPEKWKLNGKIIIFDDK